MDWTGLAGPGRALRVVWQRVSLGAMEGRARLRQCRDEEPHGSGGLAPLAHQLVFRCELGEKGAKAGGGGWGMTIFAAKVEVKPPPLVVVRTLVCRHLSPIQPPLEGGPYAAGTCCMATLLAETAHPGADVRQIRTSYWGAASANLIKKALYNQSGEELASPR